jgi:hypothetical protein
MVTVRVSTVEYQPKARIVRGQLRKTGAGCRPGKKRATARKFDIVALFRGGF